MSKTTEPVRDLPQETEVEKRVEEQVEEQIEEHKNNPQKVKRFNWRSLILPVSIFLTIILIVLIAWKIVSTRNSKTPSAAPTIQKITSSNVSFVETNGADYGYKAENQTFQAQFGLKDQQAAVSFGVKQEKAISFTYQTAEGSTPTVSNNGDKLTFKNVEKNVDIQYQTLPNGIKEAIVLNKPRQKADNANIFVFQSNFQGAYAKVDENTGELGSVFYDIKGNYLFHFEKPFAIDKAGNRTDDVQLKIEKQENETQYKISLAVNQEWLNSQDRVYPITIDPSVLREMATGGTVTYSGGYTIHTFTSSGTFVVNNAITTDVLVVAGGGNGGTGANDCLGGGGGGGGGLIYSTSFAVGTGSFSVTVGGAGANSVFSTLTAIGGGAGGIIGGNGGSGGGSMGSNEAAGTGTSGQGNNGGIGYGTYGLTCASGGGGGGASAVGGAATGYSVAGTGGVGTSISISGTAVTYAAGGNGGVSTGAIAGSAGGANTGNGGGGGSGGIMGVSDPYSYGSGGAGGAGGSGIVIIRYLTEYADINPPTACYIKENSFDEQLEVVWDDSSTGEDYYEVQRNVDEAGWSVLQTAIAAGTTSLIDSTVSSDHTYQYRVASYVSGPIYSGWCTTDELNLGVGDLNMNGLNIDGINFN